MLGRVGGPSPRYTFDFGSYCWRGGATPESNPGGSPCSNMFWKLSMNSSTSSSCCRRDTTATVGRCRLRFVVVVGGVVSCCREEGAAPREGDETLCMRTKRGGKGFIYSPGNTSTSGTGASTFVSKVEEAKILYFVSIECRYNMKRGSKAQSTFFRGPDTRLFSCGVPYLLLSNAAVGTRVFVFCVCVSSQYWISVVHRQTKNNRLKKKKKGPR